MDCPVELTTRGDFSAKYHFQQLLGIGCFGEAWQCTHRLTGQAYAVKCCSRKGNKWASVQAEISTMQRLRHDSVIRLEETIEGQSAVYVVLELAQGGTVRHLLRRPFLYPEAVAAQLIRVVLGALEYIHSQSVVHCDVKPENLLLAHPLPTDGEELLRNPHLLTAVKLADFGLSQVVGETDNLQSCCGTPYYIAPEVLLSGYLAIGPPYGRSCDLWSLGVTTYMVLTGTTPFQAERQSLLFDAVLKGTWTFPAEFAPSPLCRHFISCLLQPAAQRPTASKALRHRWLCDASATVEAAAGAACGTKAGPLQPSQAAPTTDASPCGSKAQHAAQQPKAVPSSHKAGPSSKPGKGAGGKKKKLVLRKAEVEQTGDQLANVLVRHPSVTHLDISQDAWSPKSARKMIGIIQKVDTIRLVDTPAAQRVERQQLRGIQALLEQNAMATAFIDPVPAPEIPAC